MSQRLAPARSEQFDTARQPERIVRLDGVRAVTAFAVFSNHAFSISLWMGVDLFFVLDELFITNTLLTALFDEHRQCARRNGQHKLGRAVVAFESIPPRYDQLHDSPRALSFIGLSWHMNFGRYPSSIAALAITLAYASLSWFLIERLLTSGDRRRRSRHFIASVRNQTTAP
jgi:peptidoglycan/LPS O-acetylase OafA/YrhL